jgi:hypothetical protein
MQSSRRRLLLSFLFRTPTADSSVAVESGIADPCPFVSIVLLYMVSIPFEAPQSLLGNASRLLNSLGEGRDDKLDALIGLGLPLLRRPMLHGRAARTVVSAHL